MPNDRCMHDLPPQLHCLSAVACSQVDKEDSNGPTFWALLKGAPEVVQPFLQDAPPDYEQSYKRFASEGAR